MYKLRFVSSTRVAMEILNGIHFPVPLFNFFWQIKKFTGFFEYVFNLKVVCKAK